MKIKRLEIKGFKSFPNKTVLDLKSGITSIVGPNGCGKSNVMEAIRWVMGEQRAKSLRGKKMEDVIFNGSEKRKPVGMAEVRLVLSNSDGLGPPSMADYDEIMIARRLFRDGESQYELNNISCRLSDVTDFFLDTGVGKNSYAIIEQGRVDMVVASKPEDRRVLIEEAAGISRYKARREAALKKLEQTRQNLQRISDVVGEVKRQATSIKRQAAKAQRWRTLNDRLRELDLGLHAGRCKDHQDRLTETGAELERNGTALAERDAELASLQASLEKDRLKALDTEKALAELLESRHKTELELTSVRGRMERDRSRVAQLQSRQQSATEEKAATEGQRLEAAARLQEEEKGRESIRSELKEAADKLERALSDIKGADETLAKERRRLDELKEEIFRLLQEAAQERNKRESLSRRTTEVQGRLARVSEELGEIEVDMASEKAERDRIGAELSETVLLKEEETDQTAELVESQHDAGRRIESLRKEIARVEKSLAGESARLDSLEEMQSNYAGYDQGVRFLMKNKKSLGGDAILGPLADMIEVPPEYQKALAGVLGDRLGHVVVTTTPDGVEAARRLKEAGGGRSTFIPVHPRPVAEKSEAEVEGDPPPLKDKVRFREGLESLGDFLLDGCHVVDDMSRAIEIWNLNGVHMDLVTTEGEVLSRFGEITGGCLDKKQEEVFEKKREIAELIEKADALETELSDLNSALEDEERNLGKITSELEWRRRRINELNMKEVRLRKDRERLDAQVNTAVKRVDVLVLERERLSKEREEILVELRDADAEASRLETVRMEREQEREIVGLDVEKLNAVVQERHQQTSEIRVNLARLEERERSAERECRALAESLRQHERHLSTLDSEQTRNEAEQKRLDEELALAAVREKDLMEEHERRARRIAELKAAAEGLAESCKALEKEVAVSERSVRELRETVHGLEMERVRLEQMLDGLVEKIIERYRIDPRTVPCPETAPDQAEMADLRAKLESMGEVNLAAIAESTHVEERLTFLQEQEDDLKKAVDSLFATINAINRTTKERFAEAFAGINEKFQEIFPFLFRGGEARLVLTDEEDLLETGVEIMARPPGKRVRNMDLLSGGEKALTAVALIFSIFLTKPSPFCLLDEVDAPLDDANLNRFNEMLRQLSDRTQFLIITHNKRTMEEADTLYGVTMEEPGASTVVSVQFMQ
jgi:chromosome segregation protein